MPKSKSTQPRSARRWATLYTFLKIPFGRKSQAKTQVVFQIEIFSIESPPCAAPRVPPRAAPGAAAPVRGAAARVVVVAVLGVDSTQQLTQLHGETG